MRSLTISERVSFRWTPDPPSEPTTTIVLTSPGGYFVDVRIFKAIDSHSEALQWAFAGRAIHETINGQSKGTWVHLVDSKHPSGFEDSGIFEDLPNGESLEKGTMLDDETGTTRDYEEVWRDYSGDPLRYQVVEGSGDGVKGYFFVTAEYALGVVKDAGGQLGVSKWVRKSDEWKLSFVDGALRDQLPSPTSPLGLAFPQNSIARCAWTIIEKGSKA